MEFDSLPLIVKDNIFAMYVKKLTPYNFFEELINLRGVNKEFKYRVDKILKNVFTLKKLYNFRKFKSKKDIKSIFLRDRIIKFLENDTDSLILLHRDMKGRFICANCDIMLSDECYFSDKVERVDYFFRGVHQYIQTEGLCWECYNSYHGGRMLLYLKLEDKHPVCEKVDDFINKITSN
jgi:hypothetical protein